MYEDWYQDIIKSKWTKAYYDCGIFSKIVNNILTDSKKYEEVFEREYEKWDGETIRNAIGTEVVIEEINSKKEADSDAYISKWLDARVDFINNHWHI